MIKCKCGYVLKEGECFCPKHGLDDLFEVSDEMVVMQQKLAKMEQRIKELEGNKSPLFIKKKKTSYDVYQKRILEAIELYKNGYAVRNALIETLKRDIIGGSDYINFKKALENQGIEYEKRKTRKKSILKCKVAENQKKTTITLRGGIEPRLIDDCDTNELLITALRNIIANHNSINFHIDGKMLHISSKLEWKLLLNKIMKNRSKICDYFGVKDKLSIKQNGYEQKLCYG